jgi:hypothetical protein
MIGKVCPNCKNILMCSYLPYTRTVYKEWTVKNMLNGKIKKYKSKEIKEKNQRCEYCGKKFKKTE